MACFPEKSPPSITGGDFLCGKVGESHVWHGVLAKKQSGLDESNFGEYQSVLFRVIMRENFEFISLNME